MALLFLLAEKKLRIDIPANGCAFADVAIKEPSNSIHYRLRICVLDIAPSYLESIQTRYLLHTPAALRNAYIRVMGVSKDLLINPESTEVVTALLQPNQQYSCTLNHSLRLTLDENSIDADQGYSEIIVCCGAVKVPMRIDDDRDRPTPIGGKQIFRQKHELQRSFEYIGSRIVLGTQEYFVTDRDLKHNLELESMFVSNGWLAIREDQIQELNDSIMVNEANRRVSMDNYERLERERIALEKQRAHLLSENMQNALSMGEHQRMVRYSAIVTETMNEFKRRIQAKKVASLQEIILRCFRSMVGKESMIQGISIDPATLDIRLIDYAGGELLKTQLSAGEKQLFAVSILWGLAQCSGYDMPVIIDTPLGRLDSQHRVNFVEGYLPYAGKQVIVLSTDEEIYGRYLDLVMQYINSTFTLVYDEAQRSTSVTKGYFGGDTI